jgi:hypothetical protein
VKAATSADALSCGPSPTASYKVPRVMYWPLIGGFIVFILIAVLLGWILDPDRRAGDGRNGH